MLVDYRRFKAATASEASPARKISRHRDLSSHSAPIRVRGSNTLPDCSATEVEEDDDSSICSEASFQLPGLEDQDHKVEAEEYHTLDHEEERVIRVNAQGTVQNRRAMKAMSRSVRTMGNSMSNLDFDFGSHHTASTYIKALKRKKDVSFSLNRRRSSSKNEFTTASSHHRQSHGSIPHHNAPKRSMSCNESFSSAARLENSLSMLLNADEEEMEKDNTVPLLRHSTRGSNNKRTMRAMSEHVKGGTLEAHPFASETSSRAQRKQMLKGSTRSNSVKNFSKFAVEEQTSHWTLQGSKQDLLNSFSKLNQSIGCIDTDLENSTRQFPSLSEIDVNSTDKVHGRRSLLMTTKGKSFRGSMRNLLSATNGRRNLVEQQIEKTLSRSDSLKNLVTDNRRSALNQSRGNSRRYQMTGSKGNLMAADDCSKDATKFVTSSRIRRIEHGSQFLDIQL